MGKEEGRRGRGGGNYNSAKFLIVVKGNEAT
jgi:hypothetical protein